MSNGPKIKKHGLTRTLRCAMPIIPHDETAKFEEDLTAQGFTWKLEIRVQNAKVYQVEVPVNLADTFATFVNSNWGKVL